MYDDTRAWLAGLRVVDRVPALPTPSFVTVSGAHLYGFADADSDVDLRGAFVRPLDQALRPHPPDETISLLEPGSPAIDLVAHDLRKFARLMLSHNGYVLEQLFAPLVVVDAAWLPELRRLGQGCVTRGTVHHYQGFAKSRRKRLLEPNPTVKHLLYAYRVLLSGAHLMRTGAFVCHVVALADAFRLPAVDALVARKVAGAAQMAITPEDLAEHLPVLDDLEARLAAAWAASALPDEPTTADELSAFVAQVYVEAR